jgi:hypothetical protein
MEDWVPFKTVAAVGDKLSGTGEVEATVAVDSFR